MWLLGARITGSLVCDDATFANPGGFALNVDSAEIGGDALLRGEKFKATGAVSLLRTKVGGTLDCTNATFANESVGAEKEPLALVLANTEIGGDVLLSDEKFSATGGVTLSGARIGGMVLCDNATFNNPNGDALILNNAVIGGDVLLSGKKFKATGMVNLIGARISRNFFCNDAIFLNSRGYALFVAGAQIGGDLHLEQSVVVGQLMLQGTHIGVDLEAAGIHLVSRETALGAENLRVDGSVRLRDALVVGDLDCQNIQVRGGFDWSGTTIKDKHTEQDEAIQHSCVCLNFTNAHFGLTLTAKQMIAATNQLEINLGDARVATLDDDWPTGWGGKPAVEAGRIKLNLDGFTYDRFRACPAEPVDAPFQEWLKDLVRRAEKKAANLGQRPGVAGLIAKRWHNAKRRFGKMLIWVLGLVRVCFGLKRLERHSARHRLEWLKRQRLEPGAFFPQPYRHLARVLRAHGHAEAARQVGIAEGWEAPAGFWYKRLALRWTFGTLFGFGLAPGRAALTLLSFLIILSIGTLAARDGGALVLTMTPAASVLKGEDGEERPAMPNWLRLPDHSAIVEPLCGSEIVPVFYAADMMVPAIPLHQETKCEISLRPDLWWLRWLKEIFSVLGKIITTLALITFSGVLNVRPQE